MVKQEGNLFACEECELKYENKEIAERCEDYCRKNHACNLEITKHAVN